MKTMRKSRIIVAVLTCCLLISALFVLPSSAAVTTSDGIYVKEGDYNSDAVSKLLFNRDFEDDTSIQNGAHLSSNTALNAMKAVQIEVRE